jgi:acyl carrier protein
MQAPGAESLVQTPRSRGAQTVQGSAGGVGEGSELGQVVGSVSLEHALTGVFHLAGVLDDGVLSELTGERLQAVFRPKVDGAWHLHELTAGADLSAFVLFSSVAGVMGGAGQANYAAANAFLDALASHRRKAGLAGQSLAWGLWESRGVGMTAHLGRAQLLRMRRAGLQTLSTEQGMGLLDTALSRPEASLVPVRLQLAMLQRQASESGSVPALLRTLVRPGLRRVGAGSGEASALRQRLSRLPEEERLGQLIVLVQEVTAAVMGLAGAAAVPMRRPLKELGLDSLMAVEVRNQLSARAQTRLPTTLVFDYPTPEAIAKLLLQQAFSESSAAVPALSRRHASDEPIAVVGMSCRTPGGVVDIEGYWEVLEQGRDVVGTFPERWDVEALSDTDPEAAGKTTRGGRFCGMWSSLTRSFFGIAARSGVDGSAAAIGAGSGVGGAGARGDSAERAQ